MIGGSDHVSRLLTALHYSGRDCCWLIGLRNVNYSTTLVAFYVLHFITSFATHHDNYMGSRPYVRLCLTLVAEVERCWSARQLNWGLGFFYLNRYLTPCPNHAGVHLVNLQPK